MKTMGLNVNDGHATLRSEQFHIPAPSSLIGGASYGPSPVILTPINGSSVIAGIIGAALTLSGIYSPTESSWPTIEITIAPNARAALGSTTTVTELRGAYEELREEMAGEGIPFMNLAELTQEIADRKGTRS